MRGMSPSDWFLRALCLVAFLMLVPACYDDDDHSESGPLIPTPSNVWTKYAGNPVLTPGTAGAWDDPSVTSPEVLKVGTTYYMYYDSELASGTGIGLATSTDGINWSKDPSNPVLAAGTAGSWDEQIVTDCSVLFDGSNYFMWYTGVSVINEYAIGLATSSDGNNWTKHPGNPVLTVGAASAWDYIYVRRPTVILDGSTFKMWYEGVGSTGGSPIFGQYISRIGYATSPDGISWAKNASNPVLNEGPSGAIDYKGLFNPCVVFDGSFYRMWYGAAAGAYGPTFFRSGICRATSIDGIAWIKYSGNPILDVGPVGSWDESEVGFASVIKEGSSYKMWYTGYSDSVSTVPVGQIGCATYP